ncbi:MAG: M42 family metallopeptidase [Oscillospiraceae bacterium]
MKLKDELEKLCTLDGVSGNEDEIRGYLCARMRGKAVWKIDALGNVIAFKKGKKPPENKVMVCAHIDEVGLIITHINADGTLKFSTVGGIDPAVLFGRRVRVGDGKLTGVIGAKAIHNLTAAEKKERPAAEKLSIDIGCTSAEEAQALCSPGDFAYFCADFTAFGEGRIAAKALDDRAGVAVMLALIDEDLEYDTWFVFTVQEEIGTRGAKTATFEVEPAFCVVLEATTAADIPGVSEEKRVCALGGGPVVSYMDRATIYNRELYNLAFDTARAEGIPCQTKSLVAGGNDAGAIHVSKTGVRTIAVSVPCRYLHSPHCVIAYEDLKQMKKLVRALLERIGGL